MMQSHCGFQPAGSDSRRRLSVKVALTLLVILASYLKSADATSQHYSADKREAEERKCPLTGTSLRCLLLNNYLLCPLKLLCYRS